MYASFFDKVKDWFNGVRNRETIKFNVIITIIGLILGFLFGITFGISEGFADNIGSLLGFTLIMTLVGGSFITFVANFFRRWWLIIKFGLDKQDMGWILGCVALGGIVAMVWEGVMAIINTFKTLFMDTFYLHNHKDEVIEPQYPSQYED